MSTEVFQYIGVDSISGGSGVTSEGTKENGQYHHGAHLCTRELFIDSIWMENWIYWFCSPHSVHLHHLSIIIFALSGSPAEKADLEVADEILEINGQSLDNSNHTDVIAHIHNVRN